jgi:hypothetical protein
MSKVCKTMSRWKEIYLVIAFQFTALYLAKGRRGRGVAKFICVPVPKHDFSTIADNPSRGDRTLGIMRDSRVRFATSGVIAVPGRYIFVIGITNFDE